MFLLIVMSNAQSKAIEFWMFKWTQAIDCDFCL